MLPIVPVYIYLISIFIKNIPTIIYFPSIFSVKLITQLFVAVIILGFTTNNLLLFLFVYCLKFYKKILIYIKIVSINKFLLYNKLAIIHINCYLITLIYCINYLINFGKFKYTLTATYWIIITFFLGILWSSQEILWGGFWNWNLIELSILFILILFINFVHSKQLITNLINLVIVMIYIYIYYNHVPLILSIHNFTNNPYLKTSYMFLLPLILYIMLYTTKLYLIIVFLIWCVQILVDTSNVMIVYKFIILSLIFYISINMHIFWVFIFSNYLFINIFILKYIKILSTDYKFGCNLINRIYHQIIFLSAIGVIFLQMNYNLFFWNHEIYNNKNYIFSKNKFCTTDIFFLKKKKFIWRYKINISLSNNHVIVKYF